MKLFRGVTLTLLALLALAGCSAGSGASQASIATLKLPTGWQATSSTDGKISIKGPDNVIATIWPMFINGTLDKSSASKLLDALLAKNNSDISWTASAADAEKAATIGGDDTLQGVAILGYKTTARVTSAVLYETQASKKALDKNENQLLEIFSNYRTIGESYTAPATAKIDYQTFKDESEGAYSLEYPKDWTSNGKVIRNSYDVPSLFFSASSKSKNSIIVFNDPNYSVLVEPYCLPYIGCFKDETTDPNGNHVVTYQPGLEFAKYYIKQKTKGDGCANLVFGQLEDYSAQLDSLSNESANWGIPMKFNSGAVTFTCNLDGKIVQGTSSAVTTKFDNGFGMKTWAVMALTYVATTDQDGDRVGDVYAHLKSTYKISKTWQSQQTSLALAESKIYAEASDAIFNTISEGYWSRQATMDAISERRSDATLGLTETIDSITGESRKVESGSNFYWADNQGNVVGTDTSATPGIDFHNLAFKN